MMDRRTWEEFRESGMMWFINTILHVFGWVIAIKVTADGVADVFPARVKFRGFTEHNNMCGYIKISNTREKNAINLVILMYIEMLNIFHLFFRSLKKT